jgi:hypothetical protein
VIEATSVGYPAIAIIDEDDVAQAADATEAAGISRRRSRDGDPDLRELRCPDGRAQVQAHLPLRLLPVVLRLLLTTGRPQRFG